MALQKNKEELIADAKERGIQLRGDETVAELRQLIADNSSDDGSSASTVTTRHSESSAYSEQDAPNEYERLRAVHAKFRERYPEKWEAEKDRLLAQEEQAKKALNL